jgi:hypothetical protein
MYAAGPLDRLPLWGFCLATVIVGLLAVEAGFRLGRFRCRHSEAEKEPSLNTMVGATLGLLGFMLAFTFGLAANRFETRRLTILDEANAIGTAHLRAAMLPEPERTEVRRLLREYVGVRVAGVRPDLVQQATITSTSLHGRLWAQAVAAAEKDPRSVPTGLFIQSLNDVVDLHSKRVMAGLQNRIPGAIWVALFFIAVLATGELGYQEGLTSAARSPAALALILTFTAVMFLIADLDRPGEGLLRINQQAMIDLRNSIDGTNP